MVHEQLMTQEITPKNSPEQGVDLSGKEGAEKALLPHPISKAQLQELSVPKAMQHQGPHPHPIFKILSPPPPTGWSWDGEKEMCSAVPTFSTSSMCIQPKKKKKKTTLGNDIFINCTLNCSAQPCGTTETFSLPVRWVVLHENWLFQANSINTCQCFLMRQYPAI